MSKTMEERNKGVITILNQDVGDEATDGYHGSPPENVISEDQGRQLLEADSTNEDNQICKQNGDECQDEGNVELEIEPDDKDFPSGGYGWVVVLGCAISHFIIGGIERSEGVLYLKLKSRFEQSAQATAWVTSLCSALRLCLGPFASVVSNKFSCRFAVIVGGVVVSLAVFLSGFAPSLTYLYFTYGVLGGIGRSLAYAPGLIIVGYYFKKKRGLAVGLSTAGVGVGTFVIPPLFEYLFEAFTFFGAFLIVSGICLNLCVCGMMYRPLSLHRKILQISRRKASKLHELRVEGGELLPLEANRKDEIQKEAHLTGNSTVQSTPTAESTSLVQCIVPGKKDSAAKTNSAESPCFEQNQTSPNGRLSIWWKKNLSCLSKNNKKENQNAKKKPKLLELSLLKNPPFLLFCISICLFTSSFKTGFTFLPALAKSKGCTESEAALLMSIAGVCDAISRIVSGIILDLKRIRPFRPVMYNGIIFGVALVSLVFPLMSSFFEFAVASALFGGFTGAYISQKSVIIVDILGLEKLSSSFGLMIAFQGVGTLIGPPLSGLLKDVYGDYSKAFFFGGGCVLIAGMIMIASNAWTAVHRRRLRKQKQTENENNRVS